MPISLGLAFSSKYLSLGVKKWKILKKFQRTVCLLKNDKLVRILYASSLASSAFLEVLCLCS